MIVSGLALVSSGVSVAEAKEAPAAQRPNILLIVTDDLGYNDLGVFGSEIRTPNIDRLAANGAILTQNYAAPVCAPTRAMLMSGTDPHLAGVGSMVTEVNDAPGYEKYLNYRVVSLATRLKNAGYHTYMSGKWHLGREEDQSPAARGFERSFGLLDGMADHFLLRGSLQQQPVDYREDGKLLDKLPTGFYSTMTYTDKMLDYLKSNAKDGKPFFAYLAYTAPHAPAQAPEDWIAKERGRYDVGYEVIRQRRFNAWKKLGFAKPDAEMPNLPFNYKPWNSLTDEEKAKSARIMEVYAAMVEYLDMSIGRVLSYLEETGQLDNTLVIFQSDNGPDGFENPAANAAVAVADVGKPGVDTMVGLGWSEASSAPFSLHKGYASEGGIRVPAIVYGPGLGVLAGRREGAVVTAQDVAPTLLEVAGVDPTVPVGDANTLPITGRSFLPILRGDDSGERGPTDMLGWEHSGNAAVRMGDWKLVSILKDLFPTPPKRGVAGGSSRPAPPTDFSIIMATDRATMAAGGPAGAPIGDSGPWKLFNLREDPAELYDQSRNHPGIYQQLLSAWGRYVAEDGVIVKQGDEGAGKATKSQNTLGN